MAAPHATPPHLIAPEVRRSLAAGTTTVRVSWPERRIDVWRPNGDRPAPVATVTPAATLGSLEVAPGFIHPVADVFG